MTKIKKYYKRGTLFLESIRFDHVIKRTVTRSGTVGKIYLPRELIGKEVYVLVDMNNLNGLDIQEGKDKESVKKPEPSDPGQS